MRLLTVLSQLEQDEELHLARLLVIGGAFAGKDGSGDIEGLTKLAKLDFLLRYPVMLERALAAIGKAPRDFHVKDHERKSVESAMVRFRYGPWDFRYKRLVNLLVARGLARVVVDGRTVRIGLTSRGVETSRLIAEDRAFADIATRSRILKSNFDWQGTRLKKFIYATFPEIVSLRLGEEILP